jgi:predicted alpha/beta superfamily hydrolase
MNRRTTSTLLIILLIIPQIALGGLRGESQLIQIESTILNEARELIIHLPNSYQQNEHLHYPVLYLLDGQRNFHHATGTLDLLNQSFLAQEMIVVAIKNTYRTRDFTPTYDESYNKWGISGGADPFLDFMAKELMPYVNKHYRSNKFQILSGHSLGGLLSVYAMQTRPELFQAYFAFSPSLWWHDEVVINNTQNFLQGRESLNAYHYVNMGNEGGIMQASFERYQMRLKDYQPKGFTFHADLALTESHNTSALAGFSQAYQKLQIVLAPNNDAISSGLKGIEEHYLQLSSRYKYNAQMTYKSLNRAAYHALQKNNHQLALKIFNINVHMHPYIADAYDSLADGLKANNNLTQELEARHLAIKIGAQENVETNAFKTRYKNLKKLVKTEHPHLQLK